MEASPLRCVLGLRAQSKPFFPLCTKPQFPCVDFPNVPISVVEVSPKLGTGTIPCSLLSPACIRIHHDPDFDVMQPLHSVVQDMMIHVQEAVVLLHAMFPVPMLQPR